MRNIWNTSFKLFAAVLITPVFSLSHAKSATDYAFIDDAKVSLSTRNFYFDRDFQGPSAYPAAKDWSQGLILRANSGYTRSKLGIGLDLLATAGFKLDGDAQHASTGNLPRQPQNNKPSAQYGQIGLTAKAKLSQTEWRIGTLSPMNPVLVASPARLLPQTYRGISMQSRDIQHLDFQAAYIDRVNHRDSTNFEKIKISGVNGRFKAAETDALYYVGGDFSLFPQLKASSFYMNVEDLYQQYMFGLSHHFAFNSNTQLDSQLRYYRSREDGQSRAGLVDNDLYHVQLALKHNHHKFTVSTFHHFGETAFPYLSGGETGLLIDTWPAEFLNAKERVYSLRYAYDFKDYVPGLSFMTRYTKGSHIYAPNLGTNNLEEDELDFDLGYTIQSGRFKNLGLRARYAIYDNNMLPTANIKPANETRINIDYTWTFK